MQWVLPTQWPPPFGATLGHVEGGGPVSGQPSVVHSKTPRALHTQVLQSTLFVSPGLHPESTATSGALASPTLTLVAEGAPHDDSNLQAVD